MLALSKTWLGTDTDNQVINKLVPSGYTIQHISRPSEKRGGGVAELYKCGLTNTRAGEQRRYGGEPNLPFIDSCSGSNATQSTN